MRRGQFAGYLVPAVYRRYSLRSPCFPTRDHTRAKLPFGVVFPWGNTQDVPRAAAIREPKPRTQRQHLRPKRSQMEQEQQISVAIKARQHSPAYSCPWAPDRTFPLLQLPLWVELVSVWQFSTPRCPTQLARVESRWGMLVAALRSQPSSSLDRPQSRPAARLRPLHVPRRPGL